MLQCSKCSTYLMGNEPKCPSCNHPTADSGKPRSGKASPTGNYQLPLPPDKLDKQKRFGDTKLSNDVNLQLQQQEQQADLIVKGLCKYYLDYIRPLEQQSRFETFASPSLNKIDFFTQPQVLLLGGYSVGKTSFINYLAERSIIGSEIGDQPTTSTIHAIMGLRPGQTEQVVLGNAAASDINLPFQHLQRFGTAMLNRFQVSYCDSPLLDKLTFIDTPGILSGAKQRENRDYNFTEVVRQLGANASMILVLFDASKLDISDEMRDALLALRGYEDKLFIVLNKADTLPSQSLLRVYGSLMWALARVFSAPEALRVFIGSFWAHPYKLEENRALLEAEEANLLAHIRGLAKVHSIRMVNEIVKRARQVRTHVLICNQLRSHFGVFTSKEKKQKELLTEDRLIDEFKKVQVEHNMATGDFPKMSHFIEKMTSLQMHKIPETSKSQIQKLDWVLTEGIPTLMRQSQEMQFKIHQLEEEKIKQEKVDKLNAKKLQQQQSPEQGGGGDNTQYGGYSATNNSIGNNNNNNDDDDDDSFNPFADSDHGETLRPWAIPEQLRVKYIEQFSTLKLNNGRLSGQSAKPLLQTFGLTGSQLKKIWTLSDIDKQFSGYLDVDEFVLCLYLIEQTKAQGTIPQMTVDLCPPSKRLGWTPPAQ